MHRPRALLKLQLAVLDLVLPGDLLFLLQFDEQLARLVLRGDDDQRAGHEDAGKDQVDLDHAASLSATRMTALRARGLDATSASEGYTGLPTSFSFGLGSWSARSGRRAGRESGRAWSRMKFLTMRTSREWKLITTRRPPVSSASTPWGNAISNSSSSLLM